jgi:hypothetical protein
VAAVSLTVPAVLLCCCDRPVSVTSSTGSLTCSKRRVRGYNCCLHLCGPAVSVCCAAHRLSLPCCVCVSERKKVEKQKLREDKKHKGSKKGSKKAD